MQARIMKISNINSELSVVNPKGDQVAVVHQYDRFPQLQSFLFSKFVYWVNTADKMAEW